MFGESTFIIVKYGITQKLPPYSLQATVFAIRHLPPPLSNFRLVH